MTALVVAGFDRAQPFREGIRLAREADRAIVGLWSPLPVEVPGQVPEGARRIVATMVLAGLVAAALLYLLIWWSAVHAYAFDSGGRPLHSWPAFLVAPIEFGALAAAIGGTIAFLLRARLTRLHDAAFDIDEVSRGPMDRFVIAIRCDAGADAALVVAMLGGAGAVHSRVVGG